MTSYDSDSSDGGESYTETSVLLGYASRQSTGDAISHLGGHPTWLDNKTAPSGDLAKCKVCNNLLSLLLELNGDLPERFPGHERRLYLLGCRQKTCRRKEGSVKGFRATRTTKSSKQQQQQQPPMTTTTTTTSAPQNPPKPRADLGSSIFGAKPSPGPSSSNPFASTTGPSASLNPFASASSLSAKPPRRPAEDVVDDATTIAALPQTFADKARISTPDTPAPVVAGPAPVVAGPAPPWPAQTSFPPPYPHLHLDADYETLDTKPAEIPAQARVDMDMDIDEPNGGSGSGDAKDVQEVFESSMDKAFQKFADRVAQNPDQVLRYEFGGQPLLYAKEDAAARALASAAAAGGPARARGVPRCGSCGGERTFELQLMPNAIMELEAEEMGMDGMEWGTVIMEVCARDCVPKGVGEGEVGYVEEWTGVQWEEVVKRR